MHLLTPLDYVLLAAVVLSTVIGLFRGLFREAMSLVVWIAAVWIAERYAATLAPHLAGFVPNGQLRIWAARLVLLVGVLIVGGVVSWAIALIVHSTRLGGADRAAGMVFGLARGVLLAGLVVITIQLAGLTDEPWWRESKLVPYAAPVADALRKAAEAGLARPATSSFSPLPVAADSRRSRS